MSTNPAPNLLTHLVSFFDEFADQYDGWAHGFHKKAAERLVALAHPLPGEHALDVGCGTGLVTRAIAHNVGRRGSVVGIDIAPRMLDVARRHAPANVHYLYMPAERLIFRDAAFDLVTMGLSLAYFVDAEAALADGHRVLKSGGRLAVSCQRRGLATDAQEEFFAILERMRVDHPFMRLPRHGEERSEFGEPEALSALLYKVGFDEVKLATMVTGGRPKNAAEWVDLMKGAGPLPHSLLATMGPAQRRRLEDELEEVMGRLDEDAFRYHIAVTFALGYRD
ncbi:MAG TPA: class I SAM-dependent methyltransferase [Candidatus Dormibacteraeota bacterium]